MSASLNWRTKVSFAWLRPSRRRRNRGFTLLEVLIALVIMALAMTALVQSFSTGLDGINRGEARVIAILHARSKLAEYKRQIATADLKLSRLAAQRKRLTQEQRRIRDNMGRLSKGSELRTRYVKKLSVQEDRMEKILGAVDTAQETRDKASQALSDYIAGLKI